MFRCFTFSGLFSRRLEVPSVNPDLLGFGQPKLSGQPLFKIWHVRRAIKNRNLLLAFDDLFLKQL